MSKRKSRKKTKDRVDGRKADEIRPLKIVSGVLPNADGSAYIEMGRNKIIVGVFGPREMHPKRLSQPDRAVLRCRYHMAPFSVDPRRSPAPSRRDTEIGMVMAYALEPAIFLERYPRAAIDVYAEMDGKKIAHEVTLHPDNLVDNVIKCLKRFKVDELNIVCKDKAGIEKAKRTIEKSGRVTNSQLKKIQFMQIREFL